MVVEQMYQPVGMTNGGSGEFFETSSAILSCRGRSRALPSFVFTRRVVKTDGHNSLDKCVQLLPSNMYVCIYTYVIICVYIYN